MTTRSGGMDVPCSALLGDKAMSNDMKFAVERDDEGVWLTVFEDETAAAVWLPWKMGALLASLIGPDGGNDLNTGSTLAARYAFKFPPLQEDVHCDFLWCELPVGQKDVMNIEGGIEALRFNCGHFHDAPPLSPNLKSTS